MFHLKFTVLEVNEGTFQGSPYASVLARYGEKVMRFKLDVKKTSADAYKKFVDKEVEAEFEIVSGQNMTASLKLVS